MLANRSHPRWGGPPLRFAPFLVAWINEARASVLWETLKSRN